MKAPLVSKNRAANELREQAHKLRSELMDPTASFTHEEVEKRTADIRALEMRAQAAAPLLSAESSCVIAPNSRIVVVPLTAAHGSEHVSVPSSFCVVIAASTVAGIGAV